MEPADVTAIDGSTIEPVLRRLLAVPAQQTDRFEAEPEVHAYLSGVVSQVAAELGVSGERDEIGNLILRVGRRDGPRVLVYAYAMTHPAGRMSEPFQPRVVEGEHGQRMLRGRGASEQKGSLAAALAALGWLKQHESAVGGEFVLCVSPAGETGRHDAAASLTEVAGSPAFDWTIVSIGTGNRTCVANKGRIDVEVTVRGRSGHSSMPWAATNAIDGALKVLHRLASVPLDQAHPQLGRATLAATAIHSFPPATHTIPDEVRIMLDRRLLPGEDPERALADIRNAVSEIEPFGVTVEPGPFMYPSEVGQDSPLVRLLQEGFAEQGRPDNPLHWSHGAIDAGYFNHHGVPAVMLGPGDQRMWHTDDEAVALDEVVVCSRVYAATAYRHLA